MRISRIFLFVTCLISGWGAAEALAQSRNHSQLFFDSSGTDQAAYGANEVITISGNITYYGRRDPKPPGNDASVDYAQPVSDVYLVPHGTHTGGYAPRLDLTDVNGAPNSIFGSSGGSFIEQPIGTTMPSGALKSGEYDVVFDEHQDGAFQSDFDLYAGYGGAAIVVNIPFDAPVPPATGIILLKLQATQQMVSAAGAREAFKGFKNFTDPQGQLMEAHAKFALGTATPADFAVNWVAVLANPVGLAIGIVKKYVTERNNILKNWDDYVGMPLTLAENVLENRVKRVTGMAADPPDPNFALPVVPVAAAGISTGIYDTLGRAWSAMMVEMERSERLSAALLSSLEKYQGAQAARYGYWVLAHARECRHFAIVLAEQMEREAVAMSVFRTVLAAHPFDLDALAAAQRLRQAELASRGFSAEEKELLAAMGVTGAQAEEILTELLAEDHAFSKAGALTKLDMDLASLQAGPARWRSFAATWDAVMTTILTEPSLDRGQPLITLPATLTGAARTPLTITAQVSQADALPLTVEWDFDEDGEYDDAAGAVVQPAWPGSHSGLAGARVTSTAGRVAYGWVMVTVTDPNRRPAFTTLTPLKGLSVSEGLTPLTFTAAAADPDGDAIQLSWTLDNEPVSTGGNYTYTPTMTGTGHVLRVTASDGKAETVRTWIIAIKRTGQPVPANLSLTVEAPETPVQAGAEFTWKLTVENHGPGAAANVVVTQALPPGLIFVRASTSFGTSAQTGGTVTARLGALAAGGIATVWVQTTAAAGSYQSGATAISDAADFQPGNNNGTDGVRVNAPSLQSANVSLAAVAAPSPATLGGTQSITLTASNAGPDGATGLILEVQLPESVTFTSSSPAALSSGDGLVRIALRDVANGGNTVATVMVRPSKAGTGPAYAQVFGAQNDAGLANNQTSILLSAVAVLPPTSDLTVTQTAPVSARIGLPATWSITVKNNGPDAAANVTLVDRLPAGALFSGATPAPASLGSGQASFTIGTLASGASRTVSLTVEPQFAGAAVNLVTASSGSRDANGATSSSSITVQTAPTTTANLAAVLTASAASVPLNTNVIITLTISNAGPDAATGVIARTTLPSGLAFVSATSGATHADGVATASAASLASGASAVFEITAAVRAAHPLVAVSSVVSADRDPEEANNHAFFRLLGIDPAASVAIIRNLDDPEIPKLQEYLTELGMNAQVFDDEGLSIAALEPYRLIIWNDLSYAAFGVRVPLIDILQAVANSGRPLFFIGDDLAFVNNFAGIPEPQATNWTNLIHLKPTSINIGNGGQTIVSLAHSVTNGMFGTVGGSTYNWDPDNTSATGLPGEMVLARSAGADSLVAFRDPVTRRKSVTQNELIFTQVPTVAGREERKKLFKNAVVWLLSADQPVDLAVSQRAPPAVVLGSPARIRLVVTNKGPGPASGVILRDTLPAGLSFGNATTERGTVTHSGGLITAALGSMASGESVSLEFVLNAETLGMVNHGVSALAAEEESAPADNVTLFPLTIMPAGSVTLKATYDFEDSLAACEPDAPPLTAIDPLNKDGFITSEINGRTRPVYHWDGNPAAGATAGLSLDATGLVPADNYSVEMLFRFTEETNTVRRVMDASGRTNASGLSVDGAGHIQVGTAAAGAGIALPQLFHHLVVTVAPGGNVTTYLNGNRQSTLVNVDALNVGGSGLLHFFAANTAGAGAADFSDGEVALLRVYSGILPPNRVSAQAAFPFGPDVPMSANVDLNSPINPIGVWTGGFSTTRGTPFLTSTQVVPVDTRWFSWGGTANGPFVYRSRQDQTVSSQTIRQPPDLVGMDPSHDGRNAVLRWTAPSSGLYRFQGRFQGIDVAPNGTDVALLKNGNTATTLFEDYVLGFEVRKPFDVTAALTAGETVDFSVGKGGNSNLYDSTGLDAVVTALSLTDDCATGTDLVVTQVLSPAAVTIGELTTCTLAVTNAGLRPAPGVTLTDTLPDGFSLISSVTGGAAVQQSGNVLTIELGGMGVGETREISLLLSGLAAGAYNNVAQVSGGTFDPAPANNISTAGISVGGVIPLAASVRTTVETVNAGDEFSFELVMANGGTQPAANARLSATLPAGTTFVSATGSAVPLHGVVSFPPRLLAAGEATGYSVRLRADVPGVAMLGAEASGPAGSVVRGATASGSVNVLNLLPPPDLRVAITTDPPQPFAGCRVAYTFTVTNPSPTLAFGVQLKAPVPSGLVFISTSASQGRASVTGNTLTASLGSIAQGTPAIVTLNVLATAAETTLVGASVTGGVTPPALRHRWSFGEPAGTAPPGAMLSDSIGGAHGFVRGAGAQSTGSGIRLPGGSQEVAAYVDLPNGLISPLQQVTFEGWVTVNATTAHWGHFFSFGSSSPGGANGEITGPGNTNGGNEDGLDYIALTSSRETDYNLQRFAVRNFDGGPSVEYFQDSAGITVPGQPIHFAVTADNSIPGKMAFRYYRDGTLKGELNNIPVNLSDLRDVNNWLGRGNFTGYPHVAATFDEFRLYSRLLSSAEIAASRLSGASVLSGTVIPEEVVTSATAFISRNIALPPAGTPCAIPLALAIFTAPQQQSYRLEWTATPGRKYLLQSSADLLRWVNVSTALSATQALESWIDPGPPATESAPVTETERFYRVFEIAQ